MSKENKRAMIAVDYIGGYGDIKKATGMIQFYESYLSFSGLFNKVFDIPYDNVKDISIESPDEVSKRVTATRLIALGVFALFLKKKKKEAYIVVQLKDGQEAIFHANGVTTMDVRAKLSSTISHLNG